MAWIASARVKERAPAPLSPAPFFITEEGKVPTRQDRERFAKIRPAITRDILALEKKYGEQAVSGAFRRHSEIRAARRRLNRQVRAIHAEIAKLR